MTGTWTLIKLILRRDRVRLPVWILALVGILLWMIPVLKGTYAAPETLTTLYQQFNSMPAGRFLTGPMDGANFGSLFTLETVLWWGLVIAFMNTLFVVRHTRQNEEIGAAELILSTRASRWSPLISTLIVAVFMNLVMAVLIGLGMGALYDGWGNGSIWLYSAGFAVFGLVWAAVAAIFVQIFESARTANAAAAIAIGAAFVLRGVGDFLGSVGTHGVVWAAWPSWLTPFGWIQATRSLTFPEWWPLLIPLIFIVAVVPLAFLLLSRRDEGAGILPSRAGHARAGKILRTPLGLTVYLQKNIFIGWLAGSLAMVATIGALVPQMSKVYDSSPQLAEMIDAMGGGGAMIPTFLSAMLMITMLMILAYTVQALGRARSEESSGHLENLLATKLTRFKWFGLHLAVTLAGAAIMLCLSGLTMALCVNFLSSWHVAVSDYILAGLSYWPLVACLAGLYTALFGLWPRIAGLITWIFFGFIAFMSWLGPLLKIDQWIMNLSPLSHMASAPAEAIKVAPLLIILAAAIVLAVGGLATWRERNLEQ